MLVFLFILGLAVGSFLNVCIDRLPKNKSIGGRSYCDHCKKTLQVKDLIPIVSFILLRGRCRFCHKKLSYYYPVVELLTGIMFILVWSYLPATLSSPIQSGIQNWIPVSAGMTIVKIAYLGIFSALIGIFFADLKYQIIPDELQIALLLFSFLLAYSVGTTPEKLKFSLVDGLLVMSPLYFLYLVSNGKGLGFGDVKLSFIIGFLFGAIGGIVTLYLGFVIGALVGLLLLASGRKKWKSRIAFGPFLVVGMIAFLLFQTQLSQIVRDLFGV